MKIQIRYLATPVAREINEAKKVKSWIHLFREIWKAKRNGAHCIFIYPEKKPVVETTGKITL